MVEKKKVYLFGAGVSKHAGYPLVSEFNQSLISHSFPDNFKIQALIEIVKSFISVLKDKNIEEIIRIANNPKDTDFLKLHNIIEASSDNYDLSKNYVLSYLRYAIMTYFYSLSVTQKTTISNKFLDKVEGAICTINWDILFDGYLLNKYQVDWMKYNQDNSKKIRFYKLHGSSNTLYCLNCKESFRPDINVVVTHWNENNYSCPFCGSIEEYDISSVLYSSEPLIVGFSENKKEEIQKTPILQRQWNMARNEFIEADEVIIIGLSLNEFDEHICFFLNSVLRMRKKNLKILLIDPNISLKLITNYLKVFGYKLKAKIDTMKYEENLHGNNITLELKNSTFENFVNNM